MTGFYSSVTGDIEGVGSFTENSNDMFDCRDAVDETVSGDCGAVAGEDFNGEAVGAVRRSVAPRQGYLSGSMQEGVPTNDCYGGVRGNSSRSWSTSRTRRRESREV